MCNQPYNVVILLKTIFRIKEDMYVIDIEKSRIICYYSNMAYYVYKYSDKKW